MQDDLESIDSDFGGDRKLKALLGTCVRFELWRRFFSIARPKSRFSNLASFSYEILKLKLLSLGKLLKSDKFPQF